MANEPITTRIPHDLMTELEARAKKDRCSKSIVTREALKSYLHAPEVALPIETISEITSITALSLSTIRKYYNAAKTAKAFWRLTLTKKIGAKIVTDIEKHIYVKFKDRKDYILLPQTGNYQEDLIEGTKNLEKALDAILNFIPEGSTLEEKNKEFYEDLDKLGLLPDGNPLTKNKKSSLHSQTKNKKENN